MTYTIETLIQAGTKEMAVASVKVGTNSPVRPSRLFHRTSDYVLIQGANILRMTALYKPLPVFFGLAALLFGRYLSFVAANQNSAGHIQSLLLAAVLFLAATISFLTGLLADLISINRALLEEVLVRLRKSESGPDDRA